jgi:hypothetical protein
MSYNTGHLVVMGTTAVRVRLQSRKARPVAYSPVHGLEDRFQNTNFLEESKQWISNASIHVVLCGSPVRLGRTRACFDVEPWIKLRLYPQSKKRITCSTPNQIPEDREIASPRYRGIGMRRSPCGRNPKSAGTRKVIRRS